MMQSISTSQNISKPTTLCDEIERYLQRVFEQEMRAEGSILVSYSPFVIKKLAAYLSGRIKMPASIGIAGETASGKSTITMDLIDKLSRTNLFDNYFAVQIEGFEEPIILTIDSCGGVPYYFQLWENMNSTADLLYDYKNQECVDKMHKTSCLYKCIRYEIKIK